MKRVRAGKFYGVTLVRKGAWTSAGWRMLLLTLCLGFAGVMAQSTTPAHADPVFNPVNGHYYETVTASLTWEEARTAAAARTFLGHAGHLATITSADENQFILGNLPEGHVGGFQDTTAPDYSEPGGGWRWVTGEPFTYTNWNAGEPNNGGGFPPAENVLGLRSEDGTWNDYDGNIQRSYIVEYDIPLPPRPVLIDLIKDPVVGGKKVSGQVTLSVPAGTGGVLVTLTSSNTGVATLPATVFIPEGKISITFKVQTRNVSVVTTSVITASANGGQVMRPLYILPH